METKNVQRLIDTSPDNIHSPMAAIPQTNEFLLSGPGGLGVFFDAGTGMPGFKTNLCFYSRRSENILRFFSIEAREDKKS